MGAGKSSLGKGLADYLGYNFVDTDSWIENRSCKSVQEIFSENGETFFRAKEKECIEFLFDQQKCVVSTGGGLPCHSDLIDLMNDLGTVFYLKASSSMLTDRLFEELYSRPKLNGISTKLELYNFITKHLVKREEHYLKAAHQIHLDVKSSDDLIREIHKFIKE